MHHSYICSNCGVGAYYDGRCGDGPVLMCNCDRRGRWIDDGRGGYFENPRNARPVEGEPDNYNPYENERR